MSRRNLTARFCDTVTVETRTDFWDENVRGLVFRVSPTGARSWTVVYVRESDSTKQRVTIGRFPAVTLEKARARALAAMAGVAQGEDPAGKRRAQKTAITVEDLGEIFIEKYARRHKKTWAEDQRILKRDVYPSIGKFRAEAVTRRQILDVIDAKADEGHIAQSTQVLAVVRKLFSWAVDEAYVPLSPAAGVKPRGKAVSRDRTLSDAEVAQIWNALPEAALSDVTRDIFRLLILTGQRSGEVCGMMKSEVDLDQAIWTIPASRTKNGLSHVVPLSDDALEIVTRRYPVADDDVALFSRTGDPIESNAVSKAARKCLQITGETWTPHDLRRSAATGMAALGVAPHVVEACLNHVSGFRSGVAGVYNRHTYTAEKRRALDVWASHVADVVAGRAAKIAPFPLRSAPKA